VSEDLERQGSTEPDDRRMETEGDDVEAHARRRTLAAEEEGEGDDVEAHLRRRNLDGRDEEGEDADVEAHRMLAPRQNVPRTRAERTSSPRKDDRGEMG
jgi:hypothetical protein